jgi:hypothetical protein
MADRWTAQKLWCLDQVLIDKKITHLDFRVAYYVGNRMDRATGEARFKQPDLAAAVGVKRRAAQRSLDRLKALGHIEVSVSSGRTHVNGYRLPLERASVGTLLEDESASSGTHLTEIKSVPRGTKVRPRRHKSASRHSHQYFPCSIPCLIPTRAREPAIAEALGSLGAKLEARLGADRAQAWFGKSVIIDMAGDTLTLEQPSRFVASRAEQDFGPDVLACCKQLVPSIARVRMVIAKGAAA